MNTRAGALLLAATLTFAAHAQEASPPSAPDAPSASADAGNSAWNSLDFWKEAIRFSGFARLVGGYLDEEKATYLDYDDSISFGEHSLFALQTDVDFSEQFSFTTQLLAHASHRRDSGVEWAYLTYRPTRNWQFKAGKLRTPFFMYSDTLDVGLAYPWIVPPQQVYLPYVFPSILGSTPPGSSALRTGTLKRRSTGASLTTMSTSATDRLTRKSIICAASC